MAISFIGTEGAGADTVSLPTGTQAGDLAVVLAGRNNATAPTVPGVSWTDGGAADAGSGGGVFSTRIGWKLLEAADITAGNVGTWTNSIRTIVHVTRGAASFTLNSVAAVGTASSTDFTVPAQSGLATGSWQLALASTRAFKICDVDLTDYTTRSALFASGAQGSWDSAAATSGIAARTGTGGGTGTSIGWSGEIVAAAGVTGTGAGAATATGSATGTRTVLGTSAGAATGAGSAIGLRTVLGVAAGAATGAGSATGLRSVSGTASGAATASGHAAGTIEGEEPAPEAPSGGRLRTQRQMVETRRDRELRLQRERRRREDEELVLICAAL